MYETYGEYDDFWGQIDSYYEDYDYGGGQGWSEFMDDLSQLWYDLLDFWHDLWDWIDIDINWDWFDWFGDDVQCPQWPLQEGGGDISNRSIECFTFYAWDCYENPDYNWWAFYDGYSDGAVIRFRTDNFLTNYIPGEIDFGTLLNIALQSDCDPLSEDFEQCLDWHFNNYRDAILSDMYGQMFPNSDFLPMVRLLAKNCNLGESTQAEYNICIMDQYNSAKNNIESFLLNYNLDLAFNEFINIFLDQCLICDILNYEEEFFNDYRSRMSVAELEIFDELPENIQLQYLYNAKIASYRAEIYFPQSLYNGIGDAFRHAYFNGLNCNSIGCELAESLSTAHEDTPPTYQFSYKENQMDLFNNEVGRSLSSSVPQGNTLLTYLFTAIQNGQLRYLNHLATNGRATSESQLIPTNE